MGTGAIAVGIAAIAVLAWIGVLINSSRTRAARQRQEEAPQNLTPYLTDDELESRRLDKVLAFALITAAVLAIVMPIYYLTEPDRQADAAEGFEERDIEEGHHWFEEFQCINCHGIEGVGGAAPFVEARSGIETAWAAPSINDVFYRYDESEVRYWLEFGRANSPMPAWGLEGGGALTSQQIDQVLAYLHSIELPQAEVFGQVENKVSQALLRYDSADETVATALAEQRVRVAFIEAASARFAAVQDLCCGERESPLAFEQIIGGDGTCTDASAETIAVACDRPGQDSDRDGLTDAAEVALTELVIEIADAVRDERLDAIFDAEAPGALFDPANPFSIPPLRVDPEATEPIGDLDAAIAVRRLIAEIVLGLRVTAENPDAFLNRARESLAFLEDAAEQRRWVVDFEALAADEFGGDVEAARRASGLYDAFCARCHTSGYSAGAQFTQEPGSGAMGPSLLDGRSKIQFPDVEDHVDFIIRGSENAKPYGINGMGRGWMPAFGAVLSRADIEAIVAFERWL